ncbi:MAG: hypothetical protein AAB454_00430 [Patescibacteria group bacterium]
MDKAKIYPWPGRLQNFANQLFSLLLVANVLHFNTGVLFSIEPIIDLPSFESMVQATSFIGDNQLKHVKRIEVVLTAYSSTLDQTDDSPFVTASNTRVRDGIVAANFLPFGTKIKIPDLFGDKIFVVEDRMHRRFNDRVDIWFSDRWSARQFGLQKAEIIVLES